MTIKEPQNDSNANSSYDPFSTLGNEKTSNASSYDPFSILEQGNDATNTSTVTPLEVEQDETKIATATSLAMPLDDRLGNTSECPFMKGVPTNQLPLRFQRLLDVHNTTAMDSDSVEFLPGFIPLYPLIYFLTPVFLAIFIVQSYVGGDGVDDGIGGANTLYGLIAALVVTFIVFVVMAFRTYKKRLPLRAKDSQGNQKAFPGDWKGGVYLVGNTGLLEFNPQKNKAWLFPLQSIVSVKHHASRGRTSSVTSFKIQSSPTGEIYEHYMYLLVGPDKAGRQIEQWHQRYTNGGEDA